MLRGAPVICSSSSRSSHGSSQQSNATGAALLAAAANLANSHSLPGSVSVPETAGALGGSMIDLNQSRTADPADASDKASSPEVSTPQGTAAPSCGSGGPSNDSPSDLGSSFKIARKMPSIRRASPASSSTASTAPPRPSPSPPAAAAAGADGRLPTHEELCECLRKHIGTTPAEMFLPETALDHVRRQFKCAPVADTFAKASVGEAMEAIVAVLGAHNARPKGFGDAEEGDGSLPAISAARLVRVVEVLTEAKEHFKKHATRTLLNLLADATTDNDQRLCAATLLGMMFRLGYYGTNDPYQVLADVLTPFGQVTNPHIACAIARFLTVSQCPVTPAAATLYALFKPVTKPAPADFVRHVTPPGDPPAAQPAPTVVADPVLQVSDLSSAAPAMGASGSLPPPYGVSSSSVALTNDGNGQSTDLANSHEDSARRRTVYVTRVDPTMSEGELRTILLECGDFNKVRLCGDTPGRCKYCFVEFATEPAARKMLKCDGRWFGMQQLRVGVAKNAIETNDPRDALFDNARGKVRACIFGLSMKPTPEGQSARQLANSAPPTVGDRQLQQDRKKRNEALYAGKTAGDGERGVMGRSARSDRSEDVSTVSPPQHNGAAVGTSPSHTHTSASSSGSEQKRQRGAALTGVLDAQ